MPSPEVTKSFMEGYIITRRIGQMFGAISAAASRCPNAGVPHRFQGYPRERSLCKWCGTARFR